MNQGAWYSSQHHMRHVLQGIDPMLHLRYVGRISSAAPACGYMSRIWKNKNNLSMKLWRQTHS